MRALAGPQAVAVHAADEQAGGDFPLTSLDGLATGLAHLAPDGRVLACNAAFRALAEAGTDAGTGWADRSWAAGLIALCGGGRDRPRLLRLRSPNGRVLIARCVPLDGALPGCWLLAVRAGDRVSIGTDRLAALFGLAPREAAIARLLVEGHDLKGAARQLDIAVATARVHLRNIFRKTQTTRQTALLITLVNAATL